MREHGVWHYNLEPLLGVLSKSVVLILPVAAAVSSRVRGCQLRDDTGSSCLGTKQPVLAPPAPSTDDRLQRLSASDEGLNGLNSFAVLQLSHGGFSLHLFSMRKTVLQNDLLVSNSKLHHGMFKACYHDIVRQHGDHRHHGDHHYELCTPQTLTPLLTPKS